MSVKDNRGRSFYHYDGMPSGDEEENQNENGNGNQNGTATVVAPVAPVVGSNGSNGAVGANGSDGSDGSDGVQREMETLRKTDPWTNARNLLDQMVSGYTPEDEKARKARERRERAQRVVNGIADMGRAMANMYYTSQYAPNAYSDKDSLSARSRERLEKANAERQKNDDRYLNMTLQLGKLGDASWRNRLALAQAAQQQANADRAHAYQQQRDTVADQRYQGQLQHQREREKVEDEFKKEGQKIQRQSIWARSSGGGSGSKKDDHYEFYVPNRGLVKLKKAVLNDYNIGYLFDATPTEDRPVPIFGKGLTNQQKLDWVAANIENSPELQQRVLQLANQSSSGNSEKQKTETKTKTKTQL